MGFNSGFKWLTAVEMNVIYVTSTSGSKVLRKLRTFQMEKTFPQFYRTPWPCLNFPTLVPTPGLLKRLRVLIRHYS